MLATTTEDAQSIGHLSTLLLLSVVAGIAGVVVIMWLMQVWRRSLKRPGRRRRDRTDDTDPWQLAAKRLDTGDEPTDEHLPNER